MLIREEILTIEDYCAEHKMSHKARLAELGSVQNFGHCRCEFQNNLTAFTIENNNFVNLDFTQSGATLHSSVLAFIEGVKAANNTFSEGFFGWGPLGKVSY